MLLRKPQSAFAPDDAGYFVYQMCLDRTMGRIFFDKGTRCDRYSVSSSHSGTMCTDNTACRTALNRLCCIHRVIHREKATWFASPSEPCSFGTQFLQWARAQLENVFFHFFLKGDFVISVAGIQCNRNAGALAW